MSFFHNLNKTLDSIAAKPEAAQLNERDEGKPGKNFEKIAKGAEERYGSKEAGERVAGAVRAKLAKAGKLEEQDMDESAFQAAIGKKKYGDEGMKALQKAGREHASDKTMSNIRNKYDKYDESMDEGLGDVVKKVGGMAKKAGAAVLNKVGHGDDVDMIRDLQKKMGMPQTGKKPEQKTDEAAKYRDPKYKDKLYTQEPPDYTYGPDMDDAYYNPKPDDYAGRKRKIGGSEFDHNDPLRKGQGIGRSGIKHSILDRGPRKGLPSRDQITSLKGSIKSAKGTHAEPNLPEAGAPLTAKQKSFAALAEPKDKITFADKIAGAKKEVDEMLGDVAAEAMRNALGGRQQVADEGNAFTGALAKTPKGGKFKVGGKEFTDTSGIDETRDDDDDVYAYQDPAKAKTHKTASGGTVTRHGGVTRHQAAPGHYGGYDPETDPDKDDDKPGTPAGEKRGRGRPKGAPKGPERVTAKAYKHKGGRKTNEGSDYGQAQQIYDELADIRAVAKQAQGGGQLPQGFASRLENSLWAAMSLIKNQQGDGAQVREEEKTTTRDNHAEKAGRKVTKDIEYDEKKKDGIHGKKRGAEDDKAEKAGKRVAKDIEYDEKKDEVKKDEPKKSKSKFKFGGSVYEALDAQLETLITEGMSVTVNMSKGSEDGHPGNKSITVNADGEDAERLAELLKMAGVSQHEETCSSCGSSPCGCDMIDENNPNWPTDTETSDNALQYSGGLNGPKSTGQSTVPVLASQLRRQVSMEESAKVEQNLLNLYKTFGK